MSFLWFKKKWDPRGKHCYITGGSQGLGLALAVLLASKGAHISIVSRSQEKLDKALSQIEASRQSPDQIFRSFSCSLSSPEGASDALEKVTHDHGGLSPDAVFLCAGTATPKFFVEATAEDLTKGMSDSYWVQTWTAWAATRHMVRLGRKGKIVFVSSTLGYMSFVGWSPYSPARHAVRGLADGLRSELLLYGIDVHAFFPCTMFTPGYEEENKSKPKITLEIEGSDPGLTAERAASALLSGIEKDQAHINADFITDLFRVSAKSASPGHNFIVDMILGIIAWIAIPIWASSVNSKVKKHQNEHRKYLEDKGFYP